MKQILATSAAVVSVGRLHPLVFAATTGTPAVSLAIPGRPPGTQPGKLHDLCVELGIAEAATVPEALTLFDGGLPPRPDEGLVAAAKARLATMVGRLVDLFG